MPTQTPCGMDNLVVPIPITIRGYPSLSSLKNDSGFAYIRTCAIYSQPISVSEMRPFPILLAVGLGLTLARPSPKISTVHKPHERPSRRGISPRQQAANLQARQADLPSLPTDQTNLTAPAPSTSAPFANPWLYLSNDEAAGVIAYLHNDTVLNLTAVADAGNWDNTILVLDLLAPNKSDVLSFLDNNGTAPARHAVASILFAATEEPYVQEFVVGPLPVDSNTSIWPNTWQSQAKDGKIRVFDMDSSQ